MLIVPYFTILNAFYGDALVILRNKGKKHCHLYASFTAVNLLKWPFKA